VLMLRKTGQSAVDGPFTLSDKLLISKAHLSEMSLLE
jgi:hypothetical protein